MSIRIVTHCWAKYRPEYAEYLKRELASLVRYECKVPVSVSVCYCLDDELTVRVVGGFRTFLNMQEVALNKFSLVRRPIGRNIAALQSKEEIVWFTDCDHLFGENCLNQVWDQWQKRNSECLMIFPEDIMIGSKRGEFQWQDEIAVPDIDPNNFKTKHYGRAIGGVQITEGNCVRAIGYLKNWQKYQIPSDDDKWIRKSKDDVKFRKEVLNYGVRLGADPKNHHIIQQVKIDNLYRIRHVA